MKHPVISTSRSLAAMLMIALGLVTSGCGDTASTTEPAVLGNLSVTDGTLEPAFNPATTSYTVQLPINLTSTTITATPRVAGDTIRIDNQQISSQTVSLSSPGAEQTINIVVTDTGTGGTSRSYSVRVTRAALNGNNSLSSLTVSQGTLAPEFEADVLRYTSSVANNIGSINVTPTLSDPAATMTVNGQAANSGQPRAINLNGGGQTTTITIAITAQNGIPKSYEIVVSRGPSNNNNLRGLTISPGTLNFRASTTSYTVNVGNSVPSVTLRPTLADTTASMTVNGEAATSGQSRTITLTGTGPSSPTVITIIVIAQNGAPKPYSVSVVRAALGGNNNLSALTISSGSLDFEADTLTYTVNVNSNVQSVDISATKADPSATMSQDVAALPGTATGQATISLGGPGSTTVVLIAVTAPNGSSKTYRINVIKAALGSDNNLKSLTLSSGSLSPRFNATQTNYTANVGSGITSITVTATLEDTAASMTINGQSTGSGVPSVPITLGDPGSSTDILIVVVAQNDDSKPYTVTVKKRPPAPDLIDEDDSCPLIEPPDPVDPNKCAPGTSRVDNVTMVTTPRFSITQPGSPNLYIDGVKVDSIDQGANVLKPVSPLSDGTHTITYTVTNEANLESPRSDSLRVTIDTSAPVK